MKKPLLALFVLISLTSQAHSAEFSCAGTEPFWGIRVKGDKLTYSSPDSPTDVTLQIVQSQDAAGTPADLAKVIKTKFTSLTIVRGADCTDGMSDLTYTHHAVYEVDGGVLYGCCNLK